MLFYAALKGPFAFSFFGQMKAMLNDREALSYSLHFPLSCMPVMDRHTIIGEPPSIKNAEKARNLEMHKP